MHKIILILLALPVILVKSDWVAPFFREVPTAGITLSYDGSGVPQLDIVEEIEFPFKAAVVAGYIGVEPIISNFVIGSSGDLGMKFEKNDDGEWEMLITERQDYEQENNRMYFFSITCDGVRQSLLIRVSNIFDNNPVMTADTNPCRIPELEEAGFDSGCHYTVFDSDGMLGNSITFEIVPSTSSSREPELFNFNETSSGEYTKVYTLTLKQTLYYDQRALYNFRVRVFDANRNEGGLNIFIEVEDMPNKEPMWVTAFASQRFDEKTSQTFSVLATDGDTGINAPICYRLEFEAGKDYSSHISIGRETGVISVLPINRDEMKIEFYPFVIFAFKCGTPDSFIFGSAALIVDDINDNLPEIYFTEVNPVKRIKEATFDTLFKPSDPFYIEDLDLGPHATYEVVLTQDSGATAEFSEAFNIIPSSGYQRQTFTISVADISLIDYEDPNWRLPFDIIIRATETDFPDNYTENTFKVELLNWNDELPIFTKDEYSFEVNETVGSDFSVGFILAEDRDIGDRLEYFLTGRLGEKLSLDINTGEIKTKVERAFDYEVTNEAVFQVQARDTLSAFGEVTHTTFSQVRITVLDINDKSPQLIMPRAMLEIEENSKGITLTIEIEALDPDTTADLHFTIDWDDSYAMKPGFEVEKEFYEGCFIITKIPGASNNQVFAALSVNPEFVHNIDYEKFEILYLTIIVEDLNQAVGESKDTGRIVVHVLDLNDNAPEFVGNTLTVERRVLEEAATDTQVGNIVAIDLDGPGNNVIEYSLIPLDETPVNWLKIDDKTGVITVLADKAIDCDVPPRLALKYRVRLFDSKFEVFGEISINITDTNNKSPSFDEFEAEIRIYENATSGDPITDVLVFDRDRDYPHNSVQHLINFNSRPQLQRYFAINETTGQLIVQLLGDFKLDRDNGEPDHLIPINVQDNFGGNGNRNSNETTVHLILLDVNDNAPEMPARISQIRLTEDMIKGVIIDDHFEAPDKDDPDTPNSEVQYKILSIEPDKVDMTEPVGYEYLFAIENINSKVAMILVNKTLTGFSGTWKVEIRAYDRGDEYDSQISLSSEKIYDLVVEPVNKNRPEIVFPAPGAALRIDFEKLSVGEPLKMIGGEEMQLFEAKDEDAGIFGKVTFTLTSSNEEDHTYFDIKEITRNQSQLILRKAIDQRTYTINVVATDGGLLQSESSDVRISFVNLAAEPYFLSNTWTTDFTENEEGRDEIRTIPEAYDPKNIDDPSAYPIFYFIDESFQPNDASFFELNKDTRVLRLREGKELDRENVDHHELKIICTNTDLLPSPLPGENAVLLVTITVNDVNDNPPKFELENYAVGVSEKDQQGKFLLRVHANDPDLNDVITYHILNDTIAVTDNKLWEAKDSAFNLNAETGDLYWNYKLQNDEKGYFEFQVQARDLVNHTDMTKVKVYLVAEANRVTFVFSNNFEVVRSVNQEVLASVFSAAYDAECIIDEVLATFVDGEVQDQLTDLRVHFIKNNEALEAQEILKKSSDIIFITQLNSELSKLFLNILGMPKEVESTVEPSRLVEIVAITMCGVLAACLIIMTGYLFIKQRGYQREIKLLIDTNFTPPTESALNQGLKPLPNTNMHTERNNRPFQPVIDLDTKSILSSDSDDFAGLSENPIFNISGQPGMENDVNNPLASSKRNANGTDNNTSFI